MPSSSVIDPNPIDQIAKSSFGIDYLKRPTLIIFPLPALMANQAKRLQDTGLGV